MDVLNKSQISFICSKLKSTNLIGPSGSGKTTTIIHKILYHFDNKNDFIVIVRDNESAKDFIKKGNTIKPIFDETNVKTIEYLTQKILQKLSKKTCSSKRITLLSSIKSINENDHTTLKNIKEINLAKLIIVDDSQNITNLDHDFLVSLANKLNSFLIFVGDPNQNSLSVFCSKSNNNIYVTKNYRFTPEIKKFIDYFKPSLNMDDKNIAHYECEKHKRPTIFTGTNNDIIKRISNELKSTKHKNIAIITNSFDSDIMKIIKKKNLININILTVDQSKGKEFDKVILLDFYLEKNNICDISIYNKLKYDWYIGISRAKHELLICFDCDKISWPEIENCPDSLYNIEGDEITTKQCKLKRSNKFNILNELDINKNNIMISQLSMALNFKTTDEYIFKTKKINTFDDENENIIVTNFIKHILEYYYCLLNGKDIEFVEYIENFMNNIIDVDGKYSETYTSLCNVMHIDMFDVINIKMFNNFYSKLNEKESNLVNMIKKLVNHDTTKNFSINIKNENVFFDMNYIKSICCEIKNGKHIKKNIMELCVFKYQYCTSLKYLWENRKKLKEHVYVLKQHVHELMKYSLTLDKSTLFNNFIKHPDVDIGGIIDVINNDKVIMIVFSDDVEQNEIIKYFSLYHCYDPSWKNTKSLNVFNVNTGLNKTITFNTDVHKFNVTIAFSSVCEKKIINPIIIYDLETTGLHIFSCEIIERYLYDYTHRDGIDEGVIKPKKNPPQKIVDITGITYDDMQCGESIDVFSRYMNSLKKHCDSPIFIAHNGNVFDHKIMKRLKFFGNDCICLDSRMLIRQMSTKRIKNENLSETYEIIMGHTFKGKAHRAKADVDMLIDIFDKLCITRKMILDLIENFN
jgi:Ni2+-binding GTPase involved in maturation of urease and hydrogenase